MLKHQISNSLGNYHYDVRIYTQRFFSSHFHTAYELIYTFEGKTKLSVNGIDEELFPGEFLLLPPCSIHALDIDADTKVWIGVFSADFITDFHKKYRYMQFSKFSCDADMLPLLNRHLLTPDQPERYLLKACLYLICSECLKKASAQNIKASSNFISQVTEYICEHLSQELTMAQTSEALGYEYHYFSSLFHKYFSMNFREFLNLFRFEHACELLTDSTRSITSIAEECGFSSIRNFNRVFKKMSGKTPGEYRF